MKTVFRSTLELQYKGFFIDIDLDGAIHLNNEYVGKIEKVCSNSYEIRLLFSENVYQASTKKLCIERCLDEAVMIYANKL